MSIHPCSLVIALGACTLNSCTYVQYIQIGIFWAFGNSQCSFPCIVYLQLVSCMAYLYPCRERRPPSPSPTWGNQLRSRAWSGQTAQSSSTSCPASWRTMSICWTATDRSSTPLWSVSNPSLWCTQKRGTFGPILLVRISMYMIDHSFLFILRIISY